LLPATPEIALVDEHCLYFGAFCNGSTDRGYGNGDSSSKQQSSNYTQFDDRQTSSSQYSMSNVLFATRGYIKVCSTAFLFDNFLRYYLLLTERNGKIIDNSV
jgi:mannosidase alpha-like ER degradation enhancer 2